MHYCIVPNCSHTIEDRTHGISFHRLPGDASLRDRWKVAIGRDLPSSALVCSAHFQPDCFVGQIGKVVLAQGSVPTQCLQEGTGPDHFRSHVNQGRAVDVSIVHRDHNYTLPTSIELKRRLDRNIEWSEKQLAKVRRQSMKVLRLERKVDKLADIVEHLQSSKMISNKAAEILSCFSDESVPAELFQRTMQNTHETSRTAYSPQLKAFAMTLHFYSGKAYRYVRESFRLALPHPATITSWYSGVNGQPGFSEDCLETLRSRHMVKQQNGQQLYLSMMLDEMSLMSRLDYDPSQQQFCGEVDLGGLEVKDSGILATQALVVMVVSVNEGWKLPIGHFYVHGLDGEERANLVKIAVTRLEGMNLDVISLTCDGPQCNKAMLTELGIRLDSRDLKPYFISPAGKKIYALLDVAHMIKLVRNTLEKAKVLIDPQGQPIKWQYLVELEKLQSKEGLRCGNKLTSTHINFHRSKMCVKLATQLLSSSVADSIEYCNEFLKLPQFEGSQPTVKFIRIFDRLFDLGNSRNPCARGFKAPLRRNSHVFWEPFLKGTYEYIKGLKSDSGTLLVCSQKKTPFIGFLLCMKSIQGLYYDFVQTKLLKYLLTYKMSQDHLELFFCAVRSGLGHNDNPSCKEFGHLFRKLLVRNQVQGWRGNAIPLDSTILLHCTSTKPGKVLDAEEMSLYKRLGEVPHREIAVLLEEESSWLESFSPITDRQYKDSAMTYVSGFVVRMIWRINKCQQCLSALEADTSKPLPNVYDLTTLKDNGGLIYPSPSVLKICKEVELQFAYLESGTSFLYPEKDYLMKRVSIPVVNRLIENAG